MSIIEVRRTLVANGRILLTFDPPNTDENILDESEILTDGTLKFVRGNQKGMLFHRYTDDEINLLLGKKNILSFAYSKDGTRIIICH